MHNKINHIRNLVYLAQSDRHFHKKEKEFVRKVAERLGLSSNETEEVLSPQEFEKPPLPSQEILRFILLDDLLNLMASDGKIKDEEIEICRNIAEAFDFHPDMIVALSEKIRNHLSEGFSENVTQVLIKNELFRSTFKNRYNEKYN